MFVWLPLNVKIDIFDTKPSWLSLLCVSLFLPLLIGLYPPPPTSPIHTFPHFIKCGTVGQWLHCVVLLLGSTVAVQDSYFVSWSVLPQQLPFVGISRLPLWSLCQQLVARNCGTVQESDRTAFTTEKKGAPYLTLVFKRL